MRLGGQSAAEAAAAAPGFLTGFRDVRCRAPDQTYGVVGLLPSIVTDGGAAIRALVLLVSLVRYRSTWPAYAGNR